MIEHNTTVEAVTYRFAPEAVLTERQASAAEHCFRNARSARLRALTVMRYTQAELREEMTSDPFYLGETLECIQDGIEVHKQMLAIMEAAVAKLCASDEAVTRQ